MKEPTMEEISKLVTFGRDGDGTLYVISVYANVWSNVEGNVRGNIEGNVGGNVFGNIGGGVEGTIDSRKWKFTETDKEYAIRLIREGKSEEAINVLLEGL